MIIKGKCLDNFSKMKDGGPDSNNWVKNRIIANSRLCKNALLVFLLCAPLNSCSGFDREYRLRFYEKNRLGAAQALKKRQYKMAHAMAEEAVANAKGFGEADFRLGVSLCGLADVLKAEGKKKSSEANYKHSIKVLEAAENKSAELQNESMKSGKLAEMEEHDLMRRLTREVLANSLSHLADLYAIEERYSESANCFERAAGIYQSMISGNRWVLDDAQLGQELVFACLGLAEVSLLEKNPARAADAYQRSLEYAQSSNCTEFLLGEIRDGYLKVLKELGRSADSQRLVADLACLKLSSEGNQAALHKDWGEAVNLYTQAYATAQQSVFSERRVMHCLANLTGVYTQMGRVDKVTEICKIAEVYMQTHQVRFDKDYDIVLTAEAHIYSIQGQLLKAIQVLEKQYNFRSQKYGPTSIQACETLAQVANVQILARNLPAAEKTVLKVYEILKLKHFTNKRAGSAILEASRLLGQLGHPDKDLELLEGMVFHSLKRMGPSDTRITALQATLFMEYIKYGKHERGLKLANDVALELKSASSDRRVAAFAYVVLMLSTSLSSNWFDVAEPIATIGQSILHKDLNDSIADDVSRGNWTRCIDTMEKHFGRKF